MRSEASRSSGHAQSREGQAGCQMRAPRRAGHSRERETRRSKAGSHSAPREVGWGLAPRRDRGYGVAPCRPGVRERALRDDRRGRAVRPVISCARYRKPWRLANLAAVNKWDREHFLSTFGANIGLPRSRTLDLRAQSPQKAAPNGPCAPESAIFGAHRPSMHDKVLIVDFGSQVTQLIARRVREEKVYSEIVPYQKAEAAFREMKPKAVILSGGPASVLDKDAPLAPKAIYDAGIPVLGICYGEQAMAAQLGGKVEGGHHREFGRAEVTVTGDTPLFEDVW